MNLSLWDAVAASYPTRPDLDPGRWGYTRDVLNGRVDVIMGMLDGVWADGVEL